MIRNILFDLGNVLIHCDLSYAAREIAARSDLGAEEVLQLLAETSIMHEFDAGRHTGEEFSKEIERLTGWRGGSTALEHIWQEMLSPDPSMFELLEELHEQGFGTYILSNINPYHVPHVRERYPRVHQTHGQIYSCEVGLIKPDLRIFEHTRDALGILPAETIFIDDREDNIASAESLGFRGITHKTTFETRTQIAGLLSE